MFDNNDYKLYLDDCFNVLKEMPKNYVDLILVDPPYFISRKTDFTNGGNGAKYGKFEMDFGQWDKEKDNINFYKLMEEFKRVCKQGGTIIMFYDIFKITEIYNIATELKLKQPRIGFWTKTNPVPVNARINYLSNSREYFICFCKGKKNTFNSYYDRAEYNYPIVGGKEKTIHPTQKPIKLMEDLINTHTNEGDIVLDCFMGSGSTGIGCMNLGRKFIGVEIDEKYFNIAKERIENSILRED